MGRAEDQKQYKYVLGPMPRENILPVQSLVLPPPLYGGVYRFSYRFCRIYRLMIECARLDSWEEMEVFSSKLTW